MGIVDGSIHWNGQNNFQDFIQFHADRLGVTREEYIAIYGYPHKTESVQLEEDKKPGPDPYHRGLEDDEVDDKEEQIKKQADMDDDDPDAYEEMPGDEEAREKGEVKTSDATKAYNKLYKEHKYIKNISDFNESVTEADDKEQKSTDRGPLDDDAIETGLKKKAEESGVPIGIIRAVMRRGLAAWKSGHRPGANQQQWGYARVNAFLTKGEGTWGNADKDLAKEVRDGGHDKKLKKA